MATAMYEYKCVETYDRFSIEEEANRYGRDGWRLVAVTPRAPDSRGFELVFERAVGERA